MGGRSVPAWFDIRGERGPHVTFETLTRQNNDEEGMLRSRDFFLSLVRDEVDKYSVPASQVIMGGFSQGSVMALLTGITADVQLGGVFCLCGYLPLADAVRESGQGGEGAGKFPHAREGTGMEVLMVNGEKDPIMNLEWVGKSRDIVKELGYHVDSSIVSYVEIHILYSFRLEPGVHFADFFHHPTKWARPQHKPRCPRQGGRVYQEGAGQRQRSAR